MLKFISTFVIALTFVSTASAQNSPAIKMVDYALSAVVTVAIYQTDVAMKPMGFRGNSNELAYSKALDLTGAKSSGSGFVIKKNNKF